MQAVLVHGAAEGSIACTLAVRASYAHCEHAGRVACARVPAFVVLAFSPKPPAPQLAASQQAFRHRQYYQVMASSPRLSLRALSAHATRQMGGHTRDQ